MAVSLELLEILARRNPALWELIHPHVPLVREPGFGVRAGALRGAAGDRVALNPQPLPPREAFAESVRLGAIAIADGAVVAAATGQDASALLADAADDICGNGAHPWPRHWPRPWPRGIDEPGDAEDAAATIRAEVALVFAAYAANIDDRQLGGAFADAASQLADAATSQRVAVA